jgi:hypothetical protein
MRERANQSEAISACPAPVVLFGIDGRGKPKAARFGKQHAGLAVKAATQLQLQILVANDPKIANVVGRLPVGRVHATGRTFVPFVRRDLYDQLVAAAGNGAAHADPPSHGSSGASGSAPNGSVPHLPKDWQGIGVDDLVVAYQGQEDGWYESIVVQVDGDMLTLRWRDYPRERRFTRHRVVAFELASRLESSYSFPIKATRQRAEGLPPSQSKKCETTTDGPRPHANLDRGHWMPLGPIAGDRLHPDLSRRAFRI